MIPEYILFNRSSFHSFKIEIFFFRFFACLQTNAKAEIMDELDTVRRRLTSLMKDDKISELVSQVSELSAAVDERDGIIDGLKSKMQQYVAFAENSIHGRLDAGEDVFQGGNTQDLDEQESQTPEQVQESLRIKLNEAEVSITRVVLPRVPICYVATNPSFPLLLGPDTIPKLTQ